MAPGQEANFANAQVDLNLCWAFMSESMFLTYVSVYEPQHVNYSGLYM